MKHQATRVRPGTSIEFVVGDLIDERMDAYIVPYGDPTGTASSVQRHIRSVAQAGLAEEIAQQIALLPNGRLSEGESIVTRAPGLLCSYLLHCHFSGASGIGGLADALRSALSRCESLAIQSVALPAMGTGVYGLSMGEVARTSVSLALSVQALDTGLRRVRFVLNSSRTLEEFLVARSEFLS